MNFKRKPLQTETLTFMAIALLFMVGIKLFVLGEHTFVRDLHQNMRIETVVSEGFLNAPEGDIEVSSHSHEIYPQTPAIDDLQMSKIDEDYLAYESYRARIEQKQKEKTFNVIKKSENKQTTNQAVALPKIRNDGKTGRVVIIIDDLGMNRMQSLAMINMKHKPLTLAFLPYAPKLDDITAKARANGHELIIHTPMQPMSATIDPGPMALMDNMTAEEIEVTLAHVFKSFNGYKGINNHMGSRFTKNPTAMSIVMKELAKRDLYFVDSKTTAQSAAQTMATQHGVPFAGRDVFLDHEETPEFVAKALRQVERVAKRDGVAIAIGHPKKNTVAALRAWLPTLKDRGLELVPASDIVRVLKKTKNDRVVIEGNKVDTQSVLNALNAPPNPSPDLSDQLLLTLPQIQPATY